MTVEQAAMNERARSNQGGTHVLFAVVVYAWLAGILLLPLVLLVSLWHARSDRRP